MTIAQKLMKVCKSLIISYVLTVALLLASAVVLYKTGISDAVLNILVAATYIIATFAGGIITGRGVGEKRFIWGGVFGIMYILTSLALSAAIGGYGDEAGMTCVARSIMCVSGGMLGAMLSR